MPVLRVQDFSGTVPVKGDRALPDNFATKSYNTWLYGGELRGIRPPLALLTIQSTSRRVFRVPKRTLGGDPSFPTMVPPPSYLGDSVWMQFTDPDTDIVRGQLVEDSYERYYFCSPTTGPMFNTYARMLAGQSPYRLGVPGPSNAYDGSGANPNKPTVTSITGGATPAVTRSYTYTWVNEFGEESSPALPVTFSSATSYANAIWNIGNIVVPPAPAANQPAWKEKKLYRTVTGTSGQTTFYFVNTVALATTTYADDGSKLTDAVIVNNLTLESTTWAVPPITLKGWIAMPNGFLIGFDKSNIYMSEAYHFHAWPAEYKQATETPVVGLGVLGQTCVICTEGYPATITGTKPATCAFTKATTDEPCMSRGSIVSTPNGVVYASQNGLVLIGPNGITNVTKNFITRQRWLKDFAPAYIRGARYQEGYLALCVLPTPVPPAVKPPNKGFFFDPTELKVALTELSEFDTIVALNSDFWAGEVLLIDPGTVYRWDPPTDDLLPVMWRSKEFQFPYQENFACYAIYWDEARYRSNSWGTDIIASNQRVWFTVYCNRLTVYDQQVPLNGRGVRLPSGYKGDIWQFEIRARAPVYSLHVASTMKELKGV